MVPLEILVGIDKAWKKEVFSGPRPVFCGSMSTGMGASAPARAGARTRFSVRRSRTSTKSLLVKTKPTFPLMWGRSLQKQDTIKGKVYNILKFLTKTNIRQHSCICNLNSLTWRVLPFLDPSLTKDHNYFASHKNTSCHSNINLLFQSWIVLQMTADGFANHRVFAHENHCMIPQGTTNLLQLLWPDIVCPYNEALRVVLKKLLKEKFGWENDQ